MDDLGSARYISLTTFKRDGSAVSTPVWITGSAGSYAFVTGNRTGKVKRLRNNPKVEVRVSDARGRAKAPASMHAGTAEIVTDAAIVAEVQAKVARKYWVASVMVRLIARLRTATGHGDGDRVVIQLSLD